MIKVIGEGLVVVDIASFELATRVVIGVRVPGKLGIKLRVLVRKLTGPRSQALEDVVGSLTNRLLNSGPNTSFSGQLRPKIVQLLIFGPFFGPQLGQIDVRVL